VAGVERSLQLEGAYRAKVLTSLIALKLAAAIFLPANPEHRGAPTNVIAPDALETATQHG